MNKTLEKAEDGLVKLYIYNFTAEDDKNLEETEWTVTDTNCDREGDAWIYTDLTAEEGNKVVKFIESMRSGK